MSGVDALADTRAQLTAAWDVRGIDVATIAAETGEVMATRRRLMSGSLHGQTLPPLLDQHGDQPPAFSLGRTLGQGGMGVVKAATQTALDREVAIKCLHDDADGRAAGQLLREARIVGSLEHPNIVPVHALGSDAGGRPVLVMKRIEGIGWDEALAGEDRAADPERFLRKHLTILLQVARAAHFAHQRGIVHRDIKPSNVMLGAQEEVYLVDWGIAVSHRDGAIRDVPGARDVISIEGTPAYMSPEMAAADGAQIGPRTDVYLLGATLFEVLHGKPPHRGESLMEVLTHAFGSDERDYDEWVPVALRGICDQAMARWPAGRFDTAQSFAEAIAVVLEHRASVILTEEASSRLHELESASKRIADADADTLHEIHTLFAECRFAFSHALATWADNDAARTGLCRAIELMVRIELARDAPEAASLMLRDLPRPAPQLEQAVAEALKERRRQGARLAQLVQDADTHLGARQRGVMGLVLGAWWGIAFVALGLLGRRDIVEPHPAHMLSIVVVSLLVAGGGIASMRDTLVNRMSRAQMLSIVLLQIAHVAAVTISWIIALPLHATSVVMSIVGAVSFSAGTSLVDRAYAPMVYSTILGLVLMIVWRDAHLEILGFGGFIGSMFAARNLFRAAAPNSRAATSRRAR